MGREAQRQDLANHGDPPACAECRTPGAAAATPRVRLATAAARHGVATRERGTRPQESRRGNPRRVTRVRPEPRRAQRQDSGIDDDLTSRCRPKRTAAWWRPHGGSNRRQDTISPSAAGITAARGRSKALPPRHHALLSGRSFKRAPLAAPSRLRTCQTGSTASQERYERRTAVHVPPQDARQSSGLRANLGTGGGLPTPKTPEATSRGARLGAPRPPVPGVL